MKELKMFNKQELEEVQEELIKAIEKLEKFYGKISRLESLVDANGGIVGYRIYKLNLIPKPYNSLKIDDIEVGLIERKNNGLES